MLQLFTMSNHLVCNGQGSCKVLINILIIFHVKNLEFSAQGLQLSSLKLCRTLVFPSYEIPNIFRYVSNKNRFNSRMINRLEQIILGFEIFKFVLFCKLALFWYAIWWSNNHFISHQIPIFFGPKKILHEHIPVIVKSTELGNCRSCKL